MLLLLSVVSLLFPQICGVCQRFSSGPGCECDSGFWMDPRGKYCSVCPYTTSCAGGSGVPVALPGYYVSTIEPLLVSECPGKSLKCLGANTCAVGYSGLLCNECSSGYEENGPPTVAGEKNCEKCLAGIGCWRGLPVWTVVVICTVVGVLEIVYLTKTLRKYRLLCFNVDKGARRDEMADLEDLY